MKRALGRLSAQAREVIYLRFYDGLSYERISAVLGISEQAINGRLRRAKRQLADARLLAADGSYAEALDRCLSVKRLACHVGDDIVIAFLVAMDIHIARARTGALPERLPPETAKDPYSGLDYLYEKTGTGFVLRCRGKDLAKDMIHEYAFTIK